LKETDPEFWKELTTEKTPELPAKNVKLPEDKLDEDEEALDDSELPLSVVIEAIADGQCPEGFAVRRAGGLMSVVDAERLDIDVEDPKELTENVENTELGRGKRIRKANNLYSSSTFWRHHDDDDSDVDIECSN
jgi:hypothetical protein